jgi:hypothetical protein
MVSASFVFGFRVGRPRSTASQKLCAWARIFNPRSLRRPRRCATNGRRLADAERIAPESRLARGFFAAFPPFQGGRCFLASSKNQHGPYGFYFIIAARTGLFRYSVPTFLRSTVMPEVIQDDAAQVTVIRLYFGVRRSRRCFRRSYKIGPSRAGGFIFLDLLSGND